MNGRDLTRFRKVAGLLGSAHAGERAAAALKATEMLRTVGLSWDQVIAPANDPPQWQTSAAWQAEAAAMRAQADLYRGLLEDERKRVDRLTREVARLKGMWPKGKAA
jgi:hypothetical protein